MALYGHTSSKKIIFVYTFLYYKEKRHYMQYRPRTYIDTYTELWFLVQPVLVELLGVEFPDETYQSQHYWIPYITNRNQTI